MNRKFKGYYPDEWTWSRFFYGTFPGLARGWYYATHPSVWKAGLVDVSQYGNEPPKQQPRPQLPQLTPMDTASSAYSGYVNSGGMNLDQWRVLNPQKWKQIQQQPRLDAFGHPFEPKRFVNTGGPRNTDYAKTATAQKYAAEKTPFEQQLRWDKTTKTYQKIGKLIKQGKLDIKGG